MSNFWQTPDFCNYCRTYGFSTSIHEHVHACMCCTQKSILLASKFSY